MLAASSLGLLTLIACAQPPKISVTPECSSGSDDDYYLPLTLFATSHDDGGRARRTYSADLRSASEPPLSCGPTPFDEAYRLIEAHAFSRPWIVRVSASARGYQLLGVTLTGPFDGPLEVGRRQNKTVSLAEWKQLQTALAQADFWFSPPHRRPTLPHMDGMSWMLEGRRGSEYHAILREPGQESAFDHLADLVLETAGLRQASKF